ncbi:ninjurin-1-like [Ylistrum balloti]|uniref:ninjurin-1-like n=1 Tax=Ylistrum balloti TaxID=509963 RepID=UPI002905D24B|nr:ninjurin-1-like [Ylistrum balloti]
MGKKKRKNVTKSPGTYTGEDTSVKPEEKINLAEQLKQYLLSSSKQDISQDKRGLPVPDVTPPVQEKSKKIVTQKTFTKGMMDISLLTSNATQLRSIILDQHNTFRDLLIVLLILSICLQVISTLSLILADSFKTNDTKKNNSNLRRGLSFFSMALTTLVTVVNILISAFYLPGDHTRQSIVH